MAKVTHTAGPGAAILKEALNSIDKLACKVGWFESAKYPDGTSVAYVAAIQEYGYSPRHIAPRMGLRAMAGERKPEWARVAETGAKRVFAGQMTGYDALELIGGVVEGDIRKQIKSVVEPMLAESTLAGRARMYGVEIHELSATGAKPLVATGLMIATVTHNVGPATTEIATSAAP